MAIAVIVRRGSRITNRFIAVVVRGISILFRPNSRNEAPATLVARIVLIVALYLRRVTTLGGFKRKCSKLSTSSDKI